ncbi:MAG: hypothetical protein WAV18_12970 [Roseiarcus sp.]
MSGYDDPTPPSDFKIGLGYSSSNDAINRIFESGGGGDPVEQLLDSLINGELAVKALGPNGTKHPLDSDFWKELSRSDACAILEQQDSTKVNFRNTNKPRLRSLLRSLPGEWRPVFLTKDLDERYPRKITNIGEVSQELTTPEPNSAEPRRKLGRPTNPNIDDFWIEAARLVHAGDQGSPGQKQQEFIDAMLAWASKQKFKSYAEETIMAKIEELWRRLNLGGRN